MGHEGLRSELNSSAKDIYAMIDATFERGGPRGKKWAKHTPETKIQRILEVGYYDKPHNTGILEWTGRLRRSLTGQGSFATRKIKRGCLEIWIGSKHPLALTHHKGSTHSRGSIQAVSAIALRWFNPHPIFAIKAKSVVVTIPARPFWNNRDERDIMSLLKTRTVKKVNKIWRSG